MDAMPSTKITWLIISSLLLCMAFKWSGLFYLIFSTIFSCIKEMNLNLVWSFLIFWRFLIRSVMLCCSPSFRPMEMIVIWYHRSPYFQAIRSKLLRSKKYCPFQNQQCYPKLRSWYTSIYNIWPFMHTEDHKIVYRFKRSKLSIFEILIGSPSLLTTGFSICPPRSVFTYQFVYYLLNGRTKALYRPASFSESGDPKICKACWRIGLIIPNFRSFELLTSNCFALFLNIPLFSTIVSGTLTNWNFYPLQYFSKCVIFTSSPKHNYINRCRLLWHQIIWIRMFILVFWLLH